MVHVLLLFYSGFASARTRTKLSYGPSAAAADEHADARVVLAHSLFLAQRKPCQIAKQQPVHAGMSDDGCAALRMRRNTFKRPSHADETGFVFFAAGRTDALRTGAEGMRKALVQLIIG